MKETVKLEDTKDSFPYEDILYLDHPNPRYHERMSLLNRAGQFSPFAALTGYEEQIKETERITSKKIVLDEEAKQKLDETIKVVIDNPSLEVKITYFIPDSRKDGGKYLEKIGTIHRIDSYQNKIIMKDKTKIALRDIVKIDIIDTQEENSLL